MKKVFIALCISASLSQTKSLKPIETGIATSSNFLALEEIKETNKNEVLSKSINGNVPIVVIIICYLTMI